MTQEEALKILKMGHNVFLTGAPGSGKTHTLRTFISYLKERGIPVAVTASTGIAATHLEGTTIHSWSGLGIRSELSPFDMDTLESRKYLFDRYQQVKVLIIDEISMLHHFRFDLVDQLCRSFKRNDQPFGGIQVVLCGDFFQLPPVSRRGEDPGYFPYRAKVWNKMGLKVCYLEEQHRQEDDLFVSLLSAIRDNSLEEELYQELQNRIVSDTGAQTIATKLSTHNEAVDAINENELKKLTGTEYSFKMVTRGKGSVLENLIKSALVLETLKLKIGARVMFVKNNFEKKYANGTIGIVEGFGTGGFPIVKTLSGKSILAEPQSFIIEEDGKVKAEIIQVPLRLAWAITIHKSQGMSLDSAEIDLSRSFTPGMGYVALSRVKSLKGLVLRGINNMALQVHEEVRELDQVFRRNSTETILLLEELGKEEIEKAHKNFVEKNATLKTKEAKEKSMRTQDKTKLLIDQKLSLAQIAELRDLKEETIIDHIEMLLTEGEKIDIAYLKKQHFTDAAFKKIEQAFRAVKKKSGEIKLTPVRELLSNTVSFKDLRIARLFLTI